MIKYVLLVILAILPLSAMAQDAFPAPFGLTWGASAVDLGKLGFVARGDAKNGMRTMISASAPKPWSRAESYIAIMYHDHLVKIVVQSESVTNDLGGSEGKKLYEDVKATLTAKYGPPASHTEDSGRKLYENYDEFYQCLDYSGCGLYDTIYKYEGGVIGVRLQGQSRGKGFLSVQYESPEFAKALSAIKTGDAESDANAL